MTEEKNTPDINEPKPRIMIVEDDQSTLMMLEKLLSINGFEVITTTDSTLAVELLLANLPVEVVISDWMMPQMDGVQLCSKIKAREDLCQPFFILLTARELTTDKIVALESGVDDYLTKPYFQDELVARIRAGVRFRKLQNDFLDLQKNMAILQVAATAGHEINNPLTGIFGYLDLLKFAVETGAPKENMINYIEKISTQAVRIRDIVSKLATLKKIETKPYLGNQQILDLHLKP